MDAIARWWDGIELWVTGLPFIPQSLVVLIVVVPAAFGLAVVFDRVLAWVLHLLGRDSGGTVDAIDARPVDVAAKKSVSATTEAKEGK